jgi:hypothetical protein
MTQTGYASGATCGVRAFGYMLSLKMTANLSRFWFTYRSWSQGWGAQAQARRTKLI